MKILTGKFKGKAIDFAPSDELRPLSQRLRKALVDALIKCLQEGAVLDLYSGSGALGLELLSAGAKSICFVESNKLHCRMIQSTISRLDVADRVQLICRDVLTQIKRIHQSQQAFDIILADPPYEQNHPDRLLKLLDQYPLLKESGYLALEIHTRESLPKSGDALSLVFNRSYGDNRLLIYQKK